MKLVVIYGPAASGKLTIAKELCKSTKYKLFHNHMTNDLVSEIMDYDDPGFWYFVEILRIKVIGLSAKVGIKGMVYTMTYDGRSSLPRRIKKAVERYGGKVYFVKLEPEEKELYKRISSPERKKYKKYTSKTKLKKFLKEADRYSKMPFKNHLIIDNTHLSPKKSAQKIKQQFKLK